MRFSRPLLMPPHVPVALPVRCARRSQGYFCRRTARAPIPRTQGSGVGDERTFTRHILAYAPVIVAQFFQPRWTEGGRCAPAVTLMPYLFITTARANNRWFEAARTDLASGEEVRLWWKAGFPFMGARWVVVATERLLIPRPATGGPHTRSIPFSEIYLADTSERAYGGGLLVATTLSSRYLELNLTNGDGGPHQGGPTQVLQSAAQRRGGRVGAASDGIAPFTGQTRQCDETTRSRFHSGEDTAI